MLSYSESHICQRLVLQQTRVLISTKESLITVERKNLFSRAGRFSWHDYYVRWHLNYSVWFIIYRYSMILSIAWNIRLLDRAVPVGINLALVDLLKSLLRSFLWVGERKSFEKISEFFDNQSDHARLQDEKPLYNWTDDGVVLQDAACLVRALWSRDREEFQTAKEDINCLWLSSTLQNERLPRVGYLSVEALLLSASLPA